MGAVCVNRLVINSIWLGCWMVILCIHSLYAVHQLLPVGPRHITDIRRLLPFIQKVSFIAPGHLKSFLLLSKRFIECLELSWVLKLVLLHEIFRPI